MADRFEVRIVNGRVITNTTKPLSIVWLPREGEAVAKLLPRRGNRRWLRETVRIRSPKFDGRQWTLPRSCLTRLLIGAVDRYGFVVLCRDMARLSRCTRACLEAKGMECECACLGLSHGQDSGRWFDVVGDVVVADLGEFRRTAVGYGPRGSDSGAVFYDGELRGVVYRVDRAGRQDWPLAALFMCAGCLSVPASVWDHCHTHGFVRAPLCSPCNTRHWRGWSPRNGRAPANSNVDDSYYGWCPRHAQETCSA
ncbi:endonuclease domain-containing protein [Streptomyces albidoflavus]